MSDLARIRPTGTWLYGVAALVALFELGGSWQSLHPNVSADYRAYYLDQTTTCLNQPVSGEYTFGTEVSFRSDGAALVKPLKVCGWEGPVGDGLHLLGESGRLRFALPDGAHGLHLMLELVAVDMAGAAGQPVNVVVDGTSVGSVHVTTGTPQRFTFDIPDAALKGGQPLEVELKVPDAIRPEPHDSNTRKRSIKLTAASVSS